MKIRKIKQMQLSLLELRKFITIQNKNKFKPAQKMAKPLNYLKKNFKNATIGNEDYFPFFYLLMYLSFLKDNSKNI